MDSLKSLAIGISGVLILFLAQRWRDRSRLPLPPGPKKLPLVGNLFDLPKVRQWETYQKWSEEFDSDIIHLDVAGTSMIILSSVEAIHDLLEQRSSIYSGRPRLPMLGELMGWDFALPFMNYGAQWRDHRKSFQETFSRAATKRFHPQETKAVHGLLRGLLESPEDFMAHLRHMPGRLIMDLAYGIQAVHPDDPYIQAAEAAMENISIAGTPGAFLVDALPSLRHVPDWCPGAGFKRTAKKWRKEVFELSERPFLETKRNMAMGMAQPSFTSTNLDKIYQSDANRSAQESKIQSLAATMYVAAADSTVSALGTFVLAMLINPEAQAKAQREIDAVLGAERLPELRDAPLLPYVSAIVKEVLRWQNVTPFGFPHRIAVEDEYRGYRIPAGSVVIGNVWAILHNEKMYPDPDSFSPERFLRDGKLDPDVRDPDEAAFGFGRR